MISPKLHAIWPVLFLILPQDLIVVLLMYLGPWVTANYCRAGIKSLRGTFGIFLPLQYGYEPSKDDIRRNDFVFKNRQQM
jgi:hypothetical protein